MVQQALHAVMAYEDFITGERAREAWAHLLHSLKAKYSPGLRMWNFNVLRITELRNIAATDAAEADMILIATRGAGELPREVKAWIDGWLAQQTEGQDNQRTLSVLFNAPDHVGAPPCGQFTYLQCVAREAHMGFFGVNLRSIKRESNHGPATLYSHRPWRACKQSVGRVHYHNRTCRP